MWAFTAPGDGLTVPRVLTALQFGRLGLPAGEGGAGLPLCPAGARLPEWAAWGREGARIPSAHSGCRLRSSSVGCVCKVPLLPSPGCDSGAGTEVPTVGPAWPLGECLSPSHSWVASDGQSNAERPWEQLVRGAPWGVSDVCGGDTCRWSQCWEGGLAPGGQGCPGLSNVP